MGNLRTLEKIEADIVAAEDSLKKLRGERDAVLAKTLVRCEDTFQGKGCRMGFEIQEVTYIQTHFYVPPRGCTEGDYWEESEGQWNCPECGHRNSLCTRPEVMNLKRLFKSVVEEHEK